MTDTPMAPPPLIEGYQFIEVLGSGGFADVHLYEQESPRRRVAVKVLHAGEFSADERRQFRDEANLMAQLSTHPTIVTVYHSGSTGDDRPFIVMEYCPRPNLGARFRTDRIGVDEVLTIGIQVAGAVESAHRAGVLHRDIKPANILVTEYNRPALADFGIASTLAQGAAGRSAGFSVPWAPPESFAPTPWAGPASDVYALASTLYSLLAGRSPFEVPDGANDAASLQARIVAGDLRPTGRPDVPTALEGALATAMAVSPQARYTSALSFARALQRVQQEIGLAVTAVDVIDDGFTRTGAIDTDQGRTRIHGAAPVEGAGTAGAAGAGAAGAGAGGAGGGAASAGGGAGVGAAGAGAGAAAASAGGADAGGAGAGAASAGGADAGGAGGGGAGGPSDAGVGASGTPEPVVPTRPLLPPLPVTMTSPVATASTEVFSHPAPAPTAPTQVFTPQGGPGSAGGYSQVATAASPAPTAPVVEHTVRRAASAPVPDFGRPAPKRRSVVPGIILDAALVLGVAGAAAFLLLTK